MTSIEDLVSDQSQHVRGALATQVSGLAPILGKEEYVSCIIHVDNKLTNCLGLFLIFCQCSCKC
jgi:hypothetical protein